MVIEGRSIATPAYRYGFNGQEKDDEISGNGNHNTATYWAYDTRLGRRWNLDPVPQTWLSDYSVMNCNPIWHFDHLGNKFKFADGTTRQQKKEIREEIKQLRKSSATGNQIYLDLKRSDNTHFLNYSSKPSRVDPIGDVSDKGVGTNIYINPKQKLTGGAPNFVTLGHEFGHAWRFDKGLVEPDLPARNYSGPNFDSDKRFKQVRILADRRSITEEREASHIENIIRAEVDPSGANITLRKTYDNVEQFADQYGALYLHQINIDVVKEGFNYYNKDKTANYQSLLKSPQ